jgi:hypothetical protein
MHDARMRPCASDHRYEPSRWPSSLDYNVDAVAGTAAWHGTVTRIGECPVRMVVEDAAGARGELMLTFVLRPAPTFLESIARR